VRRLGGRLSAGGPLGAWFAARLACPDEVGKPRLFAYVRSAPVTYGYLAILLVTTCVLASTSGQVANRLLLQQSTNLHQLAHDPVRVLISSAFWLSSSSGLVVCALLFTLVLAPVERRIGSWRTSALFGLGHIGATLLTAAGLWIALHFDAAERSVVNAQDVGPSYGLFAVAGAMIWLVRADLRRPYAAALVAYVSLMAALSGSFTDYGHLIALALGIACYHLITHAPNRTPYPIGSRPPGRPTHNPGPASGRQPRRARGRCSWPPRSLHDVARLRRRAVGADACLARDP
jgi:hypothetical protein